MTTDCVPHQVKGQLEEAEQIMAEAAPATALVERAQQFGALGDGLIVVDALADRPLKGLPTVAVKTPDDLPTAIEMLEAS